MHMITNGMENIGETFLQWTEMCGNTQTIPCLGPDSSLGCKSHSLKHESNTNLTFSSVTFCYNIVQHLSRPFKEII